MGHTKVTTTLGIYTHLFATDDHADAMRALDAITTPEVDVAKVVRLRG